MNIYEKFLNIQKQVDRIVKDGENKNDKYDYVSGSNVLSIIRPMLNDNNLLFIPKIVGTNIIEGQTRSGTARFVVELTMDMQWVDVESGETLSIPFYANGSDLGSAERAVGKALTYAEKYILLKLFHIPTDKDDPDNDGRTKAGELRSKGTAAAKETTEYMRAAIPEMFSEIFNGDAEKIKAGYIALTKSDKRGYAGVDNIGAVTDAQLSVLYGRIKAEYKKRMGKDFKMEVADNGNA